MRVVIAEDSVPLREGLSRLLIEAGVEVVGAASDAETFLREVDAAGLSTAVASGNITIVVPAGTTYYIVANVVSGSKHIEVETGPNSHHTMYLSDDSGDINVLPAS